MTDYELEEFCGRNPDCGCNCLHCIAFARNRMYELGYDEDEDDDDEFDMYDY